jgi:hypothetical protein
MVEKDSALLSTGSPHFQTYDKEDEQAAI